MSPSLIAAPVAVLCPPLPSRPPPSSKRHLSCAACPGPDVPRTPPLHAPSSARGLPACLPAHPACRPRRTSRAPAVHPRRVAAASGAPPSRANEWLHACPLIPCPLMPLDPKRQTTSEVQRGPRLIGWARAGTCAWGAARTIAQGAGRGRVAGPAGLGGRGGRRARPAGPLPTRQRPRPALLPLLRRQVPDPLPLLPVLRRPDSCTNIRASLRSYWRAGKSSIRVCAKIPLVLFDRKGDHLMRTPMHT